MRDSYARQEDDRDPDRRSPPSHSRRYDDRDRGRDRAGYSSGPPRRRGGPPASRPAPQPSNIVGAFGLSIRTTERDLEDEFQRVGPVEKVVIVYDARTGRSRGFGFVTMQDVDSASEAVKQLNDVELHGRRIRVDFSSTTRPHDPTPGEYRGNPRAADERGPRSGGPYRGGGGYPPSDRFRDRDDRDYRRRSYGRDRDDRYARSRDDRGGYGRPPPPPYGRDRDDRYGRYPRDDRESFGGDRYADDREDRYARNRESRYSRDRYDDGPRYRDDRDDGRSYRRGSPSGVPDWRRDASPVRGSSPSRPRSRSPDAYRDERDAPRYRGDGNDGDMQDRYADMAP
ncbi:hypothetical protein MYAM1_000357 [Malassezia yamatoensis]|uniref:RRM domain-containing protein n=1 Tax=Malassezia yamatoensis TaxID=253288 RepID=A0AAJ5YNM7_9BASI|nr:hypothetical protein MYAM1_000357 [Malassezia yamatoensis]